MNENLNKKYERTKILLVGLDALKLTILIMLVVFTIQGIINNSELIMIKGISMLLIYHYFKVNFYY